MTTNSASYLTELHQLINQYFNLAEIQMLCLDLHVDYESVAGEEKPSRIRELLLGLGRNGRLPELITLLQQERPKVNWPLVPEDFEMPEALRGETAVPANQYHVYGDWVQGDLIHGDKIAGHKIQTTTYIEKQVNIQGGEITDLEQLPPEAGDPPYQGLRYFDEKDADWFFGRERVTAVLINRLHEINFLAVVGDSGSGKSSIVRAGVVPVIKRIKSLNDGSVPLLGTWQVMVMTPTARPLEKLVDTLFPDDNDKQATVCGRLSIDQGALRDALTNHHSPEQPLLLVIDQFEELFSQCKEEYQRESFVANVVNAAQPTCKIILTLRADFYASCLRYEPLRLILKEAQEPLGPMNHEELQAAILGPAAKGAWKVQIGLAEEMLEDAGQEPGALPLLSHALRETWERRHGHVLTLSGYRAAGGVKGAIAQTAEGVYQSLTPDEQALAQQIFLRLTELGEGTQDTRRHLARAELRDVPLTDQLTKKLADARLITTTENGLEVAHEALIREWPRLREWLDTDREGLLVHRRLTIAAIEWQEKGEEASLLHQGLRLAEAEQWVTNNPHTLSELECQFLESSLKRRLRWRYIQFGVAVLLVASIMAIIGFPIIIGEKDNAVTARETAVAAQSTSDVNAALASTREVEALAAQSTAAAAQDSAEKQGQINSLIAQSQALMNTKAPNYDVVAQARLMAAFAGQLDREVNEGHAGSLVTQWNYKLTRDITASYQPLATLTVPVGTVGELTWHPNGSQLASVSEDGMIIVWDTENWLPQISHFDHLGKVHSVIWDDNGHFLITTSSDNNITIWNTASENPPRTLEAHQNRVTSVAWNPDSSRLASADSNGTVIIWDIETWEPLITLPDQGGAFPSLIWNSDGSRLTFTSTNDINNDDGTIIVWDTDNWQPLFHHIYRGQFQNKAVWNSNGDRLAAIDDNNDITVWNSISWQPVITLTEHTHNVGNIDWDNTGSRLASGANDNSIIIWDTMNWQPLITLSDGRMPVADVLWNRDGTRLASTYDGEDNIITIWDTENWQPLTVLSSQYKLNPTNLAWASDGNQLANADVNEITIWDTKTWQSTTQSTGIFSLVSGLDGNANHALLASALYFPVDNGGGIVIWDTINWQPEKFITDYIDGAGDVAWNREGSLLACTSSAGIVIWNTNNWQPTILPTNHVGTVTDMAWNSDGSHLASLDEEGTIVIWNSTNWEPLKILSKTEGSIEAIEWSADDHYLATAGFGAIAIWDTNDWQLVRELSYKHNLFTSLSWNPNEDLLASSSGFLDTNVTIWDTSSWQPLITLTDHELSIVDIAWDMDGSHLASVSSDATIVTNFEDSFVKNCDLARRNFTWDEWQNIYPNEPYQVICSQWPVHPSVPPEK